ncbi:MAG: hypothetical protein ABEJ78_12060 [Haloferacaceae archaeon]
MCHYETADWIAESERRRDVASTDEEGTESEMPTLVAPGDD